MTKVTLIVDDNINALKGDLLKNYKPNIIYIDPPYNTKNSSLVYKDSFTSNQWIDFMKPRIEKAYEIADTNSIFYFSIGDQQLDELIRICRPIFKNGFVALMPRISNMSSKTTKLVSKKNDWLLIYKKGRVSFHGKKYKSNQYKLEDKHVKDRGMYQLRRLDYKDFHYSPPSDIKINFEGKNYYPNDYKSHIKRKKEHLTNDWCWLWCKERIEFAIKNDWIVEKNGNLYKKTYWRKEIKKSKNGGYEQADKARSQPIDTNYFMDKHFNKKDSNKYIKYFTYPKSTNFLDEIVRLPKFNQKRVLDLFAGSGSISHSVKLDEDIQVMLIQKDEKINAKSEDLKIKKIHELTKKVINEWKIKLEIQHG